MGLSRMVRLLVIGSLLLVPSLVTNLPTVTAQATDERCFAETGFCIHFRKAGQRAEGGTALTPASASPILCC
jgi:hypothetical protein